MSPGFSMLIKRLRAMAVIGLLLSIGVTALGFLSLLFGSLSPDVGVHFTGSVTEGQGSNPHFATLACTGTVFALAMRHLIKMLGDVAEGDGFSGQSARHLRAFGFYVLVAALIAIAAQPLAALLGLLPAADGQVRLFFNLSDMLLLVTSALLYLLSHLFTAAQRLAEDNRQIV